jgi:hypothetical protein
VPPARAVDPVIGGASYGNVVNSVHANGNPQRVADVFADDDDPDAIHLYVPAGGLSVFSQGQALGDCTGISVDAGLNVTGPTIYSITETGLPFFFTADFVPQKVGELYVSVPVTVGNNCILRKAVVEVTFIEQDP